MLRRHRLHVVKKGNGRHDWDAKGCTNVIVALSFRQAVVDRKLILSSSLNTAIFTTWLKEELIHKLSQYSVVIMDNSSFHKGKDMQQTLEDAGHTLLYLAPYSPDLPD